MTTQLTERQVEQERIIRRIAALWAAHPGRTFGDVLLTAISAHARYTSELGYYTNDSEVEHALDAALAAEGLTVAGGWKS